MTFLFDYGDEWLFRVEKVRPWPEGRNGPLARALKERGEAPEQYPDADEDDAEEH